MLGVTKLALAGISFKCDGLSSLSVAPVHTTLPIHSTLKFMSHAVPLDKQLVPVDGQSQGKGRQ